MHPRQPRQNRPDPSETVEAIGGLLQQPDRRAGHRVSGLPRQKLDTLFSTPSGERPSLLSLATRQVDLNQCRDIRGMEPWRSWLTQVATAQAKSSIGSGTLRP